MITCKIHEWQDPHITYYAYYKEKWWWPAWLYIGSSFTKDKCEQMCQDHSRKEKMKLGPWYYNEEDFKKRDYNDNV